MNTPVLQKPLSSLSSNQQLEETRMCAYESCEEGVVKTCLNKGNGRSVSWVRSWKEGDSMVKLGSVTFVKEVCNLCDRRIDQKLTEQLLIQSSLCEDACCTERTICYILSQNRNTYIQSIVLGKYVVLSARVWNTVAECYPNLNTLILQDYSRTLQSLEGAQLLHKLRNLVLGCDRGCYDDFEAILNKAKNAISGINLKSLEFVLINNHYQSILQLCKYEKPKYDPSNENVWSLLKGLELLSFEAPLGSAWINKMLSSVASNCPNIKSLHFSKQDELSENQVSFVKTYMHLDTLRFSDILMNAEQLKN